MFHKVSQAHAIMISLSVLMTAIFIIGIRKTKKRTYVGFGLDSIFMLICFAMMVKFLYYLR